MSAKISEEKRIAKNKIHEFKGIVNLIVNGNYNLAVTTLEGYLKKYPGNSYGIKEYASILRQQGYPEEALKVLSQSTSNKNHVMRERAYCYIAMGDYEKALETLEQMARANPQEEEVKSFCRAKLGCCDEVELSNYYIRQASSYDKNKAISYIRNNPRNRFDHQIKIKELYDNIENILGKSSAVISLDFYRKYYFNIPNVGYVEGEPTNHIAVYTFPDTLEIVNMYPQKVSRNVPINDYDKLCHQEEMEKVKTKQIKRESQVDKFNRRYGKMNWQEPKKILKSIYIDVAMTRDGIL